VEGVAGRVRPRGLLPSVHGVLGVVDLHPVHEEESFAEAIVAPGVRLIAVEAKALATPFRHLVLGEAADVALGATLLIGGQRSRQCQRLLGGGERRPGSRDDQETALGRSGKSRNRPRLLHQFHLAHQAHSGGQSLRVVEADDMAERRKEAVRVQLDPLRLFQSAVSEGGPGSGWSIPPQCPCGGTRRARTLALSGEGARTTG